MKNLKNLGLTLFAVSSMVVDSSSQQNYADLEKYGIYNDNEVQNETEKRKEIINSGKVTDVKEYDKEIQRETGILYATKIFWSEKNHEVYFEGRVKVNFGGNNFNGNGSFTCLGKVLFLVVDDVPVKLNTTIKLKDKKYEITRLSKEESIEKYGDNGQLGAVEITMVK